jgi:ubiquinone/menaquinone biosynthesis C-methylase UbiE
LRFACVAKIGRDHPITLADEIWGQVPSDRPIEPEVLQLALDAVANARAGGEPRVLDLGCGDGRITAELGQAGARATGVDPSSVAIERARAAHPELEFAEAAADLPFADASFDAVVCLHVLQHVADTQRLMSEARRVLAPGGQLAIAVPFHGVFKNLLVALRSFERHHDPLEPVLRFYTKRSLAGLLRDFGFEQVRMTAAGGLPLLRETLLAQARRGVP